MPLLRFIGNLLLAIILVGLSCLVIGTAYGAINLKARELQGLDYGAADGRWIWIEGQPIYYRTWGPEDGRPMVLVHGYQVEGGETWAALGEMLSRANVRVIAVDLRGFGHSARDATRTYSVRQQAILLGTALNQMGIRGATLVTHGWGAAVAMQLASEQPQFVRQLVLIAPEIERERPALWRQALHVPYVGHALIWAEQSGGPLWRALQRRGFADPSLLSDDYWRRIEQPTRIVGTADALLAMATSPRDDDLPAILPTLKAPVLILVGEEGAACPQEQAEALAQQLPQAEVRVIARAGDFAHIEQRAAVSQAIVQWALYGER
jgi:pimeloyl-ACP methyl ester carboxylesterase